jgi:hypothetical protein
VHFRGTLITDNPIIFDGGNITLEAQPGFPALVTTGYIYLTNNARVTINGVVVTKWPISPLLGTSSSRLIINGAVFGDNDGFASTLSGSHTVTYDAARARLYDLGTTVTGTAGVTDWLE